MSPNITTSLGDMRRMSEARRVKRNLFGPIDQEKSKLWVETQLENLLVNACEKWSFDFRNEKPLNSDKSQYVWERMESNTSMEPPSPKSVAMRGLRLNARDMAEDEQNNNIENSVQYVKTGDILSFKQRQTRMTDFLAKRKRPVPMSLNSPGVKRLKETLPRSNSSSSSTGSMTSSASSSTSNSSEDLSAVSLSRQSSVARLLF